MEKPCEIEWLRGNLFRIVEPNSGLEWIVEAPILAQNIANAARAYRDFRTRESAEIIQFPVPEAEAAH